MGIDFGGWLGGGGSIVQMQIPFRSQVEWSRIQDNPTDVQFMRKGVELEPQTVRIELENSFLENDSDAGAGSYRKGTIHGLRAHPDPELGDLNVAVMDTFRMDDKEFTIMFVSLMDYCIKAEFEVVG